MAPSVKLHRGLQLNGSRPAIKMEDDYSARISEPRVSPPRVINDTKMCTAEERLQELEKKHEVVSVIADYARRNFKSTKPPAWLDLRKVAQQLLRSSIVKSSKHVIIRGLSQTVSEIKAWKADHASWKEAAAVRKMPYVGDRSEILAVQLVSPGVAESPDWTRSKLMDVGLQFLSAHEPRASEAVDAFWQGAKLEDAAWRGRYMAAPVKAAGLPFEDDLNYLVLTSVCGEKPRAREKSKGATSTPEMITPRSNITLQPAPSENCDAVNAWEKEVGVSFDRIMETLMRVVADERIRLLGKRAHQDQTVQNEAKRQRLAPDTPHHRDRETDDTCGNGSSARPTIMDHGAKRVERYAFLRSSTSNASQGHDKKPAGLSGNLENSEAQLGEEEVSRGMVQVLNELLRESKNQITEKLGKLEAENKSLRDEMALQRDEIALQRNEMALQRGEFERGIEKLVCISQALHDSYQALQEQVDLQAAAFKREIKSLWDERDNHVRAIDDGDGDSDGNDLARRLDEQNARFEEEREKLDGRIDSLKALIDMIMAQTLSRRTRAP
ncbi:hypothetical protein QBC42DRAFT_295182 [Cladorrhinum samala]|uniref:Uncharacterized protein n=1 Tax=Cladorrhinum samala TaxID=585594 RepID=A0AAV9HXE2_9PEZI|nr:hypothetical protein QBC42DRAFT_295182 [Cladorrhinum samala]